jgi:hypothetical protein
MSIYEVLRLDAGLGAWEASTTLTASYSQSLILLFFEQWAGSSISAETTLPSPAGPLSQAKASLINKCLGNTEKSLAYLELMN